MFPARSGAPRIGPTCRRTIFGSDGYRIPTGSSQSKSLPWFNVDQIVVAFSEDVDVQAADLSISRYRTLRFPWQTFRTLSTVNRQLFGNVDIFYSFAQKRLPDRSGWQRTHPVKDLTATPSMASGQMALTPCLGNGSQGGDFAFTFRVMPGDVNQNNGVDYADYSASSSRQGLTTTSTNYSALADIDGSGVHELAKYQTSVKALVHLSNGISHRGVKRCPHIRQWRLSRGHQCRHRRGDVPSGRLADAETANDPTKLSSRSKLKHTTL